MSESTPLTPPPDRAVLPYPLRWGEAVYLDMRAEWRRFLPAPDFSELDYADESDVEIAISRDLVEGSPEWQRLLPDRVDLERMRRADEAESEMEFDDGKPVFYLPRKLLNILIIAALIALLAYEFYGLFTNPAPPVPRFPTPPLDRI